MSAPVLSRLLGWLAHVLPTLDPELVAVVVTGADGHAVELLSPVAAQARIRGKRGASAARPALRGGSVLVLAGGACAVCS